MSQERRDQEMRRMLGVLGSGFKLVGRAFRTFELINNDLVEQYTLKDGAFPVGSVNKCLVHADISQVSIPYAPSAHAL